MAISNIAPQELCLCLYFTTFVFYFLFCRVLARYHHISFTGVNKFQRKKFPFVNLHLSFLLTWKQLKISICEV